MNAFVEFAELHRQDERGLLHTGPCRRGHRARAGVEQQALAEYLIRHPVEKRAQQRLALSGGGPSSASSSSTPLARRSSPPNPPEGDDPSRQQGRCGFPPTWRTRRLEERARPPCGTAPGNFRPASPSRPRWPVLLLYLGGFQTGGIHFGGVGSGTGKTTHHDVLRYRSTGIQ